jgi:hypothetical protein
MKQLFARNKIRGVSFHRTGAPLTRKSEQEIWRITPDLHREIRNARPAPLSRNDILRLLEDFARVELHSLVLESIEQCGRWRQIQRLLERTVEEPQGAKQHPWSELSGHPPDAILPDEATLLLATRHIYRQWRHRLDVLELIAEGQSTHHTEMVYSMKHGRRGQLPR